MEKYFMWTMIGTCVICMIFATIACVVEAKKQKKFDKTRMDVLNSLYSTLVGKNITEHIEQLEKTGHIFLDHYVGEDKIDEIYVVDYFPRKEEYQLRVFKAVWDDKKKGRTAKLFVNMMAIDSADIISFLEDKYRV